MAEFNDRRPRQQPTPKQPRNVQPASAGGERFFHGTMDTERFSFNAFGRTPEEVHKALDNGFKEHLQQYGTSLNEWKQSTGAKRPTDHYEPQVRDVSHGYAYRDGEELGGPKREPLPPCKTCGGYGFTQASPRCRSCKGTGKTLG